MVLDLDQYAALFGLNQARTGLINTRYRWTDNTVPYVIGSVFDAAQVAAIEAGLRDIESISCIRFVARTTQANYVTVTGASSGCHSSVGMRGTGSQTLNLQLYAPGSGCFRHGTIVHEFLHALGFYHMQSASERDDYVTIMWDNIQAGYENNFSKHAADVVTNFGIEYDFGSVMHYGAYGFAIDPALPTIVPNIPNTEIGQRIGMSERDIARLKAMYCTAA